MSIELQDLLPNTKGLSMTNFGYIKRLYLLYSSYTSIHPQAEGELFSIPWEYHKYIIDKFYNKPWKAIFYVRKALRNRKSKEF